MPQAHRGDVDIPGLRRRSLAECAGRVLRPARRRQGAGLACTGLKVSSQLLSG